MKGLDLISVVSRSIFCICIMERLEYFATRVRAGDLEEMNVNVRWQVESMRSDKKD